MKFKGIVKEGKVHLDAGASLGTRVVVETESVNDQIGGIVDVERLSRLADGIAFDETAFDELRKTSTL